MFQMLIKVLELCVFAFLTVFTNPDKLVNSFIADAFNLIFLSLGSYQFRTITFVCHPLFGLLLKFVSKTNALKLYFMSLPGGSPGDIFIGIDSASGYVSFEFPANGTLIYAGHCSDFCLSCSGTL